MISEDYGMFKKAVSNVVALALILLIAVIACTIAYFWIIGYVPLRYSSYTQEVIKIEGVKIVGNVAYIYVRNLGTQTVTVTTVYLSDSNGLIQYQLSMPVFSSSTEIWGGDVWRVDVAKRKVVLESSGKIINGTDSWQTLGYRVLYGNIEEEGFLKISSVSATIDKWSVYGLITPTAAIDLTQPLLLEVKLRKLGENAVYSPHSACLYLLREKTDPYSTSNVFAVKIAAVKTGTEELLGEIIEYSIENCYKKSGNKDSLTQLDGNVMELIPVPEDITLVNRHANWYDSFDSNTFSRNKMTIRSGDWVWISSGYIRQKYTGYCSNGVGGTCVATANGISVSIGKTYRVLVKVHVRISNDKSWIGIYIPYNPSAKRTYELALERYDRINPRRFLYIGEYDQKWRYRNSYPYYWSTSYWYTLYAEVKIFSSKVSIFLKAYSPSGDSSYVKWTDTYRVITSGYIGIGTGYASADFDDLIIVEIPSTSPNKDPDPCFVKVTNLFSGWKVEIRDSSGALVGSATADPEGVARVSVIKKPIIKNGRIIIYDGSIKVFEKQFDEIVGGDEYKVTGYKLVKLKVTTVAEKSSLASYKLLVKVSSTQNIGVKVYAYDWSASNYVLVYSGNTPINEELELQKNFVNSNNGTVKLKLVQATEGKVKIQIDALNVKAVVPKYITKAIICSGDAETPACELYTWSRDENPAGVFLLSRKTEGVLKYYFWAGDRTGDPTATGTISAPLGPYVYAYLAIDNIESSEHSIAIDYIRACRGSTIVVKGLGSCWTVNITDLHGNVFYSRIAGGYKVEINLTEYYIKYGVPLHGHIIVIPCNLSDYNVHRGWVIPPNGTREIVVSLPSSIKPGEYIIKVVTKKGTVAAIRIKYG